MAFKHIVVAFDGSTSADKALSYAKDMVQETVGCTLRIVSVTSNPDAVIPLDISSNDFAPNAHLIDPSTLLKLRERALEEATATLHGEVDKKIEGLARYQETAPVDALHTTVEFLKDWVIDHTLIEHRRHRKSLQP